MKKKSDSIAMKFIFLSQISLLPFMVVGYPAAMRSHSKETRGFFLITLIATVVLTWGMWKRSSWTRSAGILYYGASLVGMGFAWFQMQTLKAMIPTDVLFAQYAGNEEMLAAAQSIMGTMINLTFLITAFWNVFCVYVFYRQPKLADQVRAQDQPLE
jgi:hypothetical protein